MEESTQKIAPPLKWAGGKRWFVEKYPKLLEIKFERYIEPFLGSGAVYFHLRPKKAIVSDLNSELITTYTAIKLNWKLVLKALKLHNSKHSAEYYYKIRGSNPSSIYGRAARLLYLNRTCWNALYRVNRNGKFNVPKGTKDTVLLDSDDFAAVSECLSGTLILNESYKTVIARARRGDLVFADPPYTISHNNNGFIKYNETIFSWKDQITLSESLLAAKRRGASILLTNAWHGPIRKLYQKHFKLRPLSRISVIAADPRSRGVAKELLVFN